MNLNTNDQGYNEDINLNFFVPIDDFINIPFTVSMNFDALKNFLSYSWKKIWMLIKLYRFRKKNIT